MFPVVNARIRKSDAPRATSLSLCIMMRMSDQLKTECFMHHILISARLSLVWTTNTGPVFRFIGDAAAVKTHLAQRGGRRQMSGIDVRVYLQYSRVSWNTSVSLVILNRSFLIPSHPIIGPPKRTLANPHQLLNRSRETLFLRNHSPSHSFGVINRSGIRHGAVEYNPAGPSTQHQSPVSHP